MKNFWKTYKIPMILSLLLVIPEIQWLLNISSNDDWVNFYEFVFGVNGVMWLLLYWVTLYETMDNLIRSKKYFMIESFMSDFIVAYKGSIIYSIFLFIPEIHWALNCSSNSDWIDFYEYLFIVNGIIWGIQYWVIWANKQSLIISKEFDSGKRKVINFSYNVNPHDEPPCQDNDEEWIDPELMFVEDVYYL